MSVKVAVVTGANKGLGLSVVKALCKLFTGIVYLTARDESKGLEAVKSLNALGLNPQFYQLDITDKNSVKEFAEFIEGKHGGIDVLVNNAAILDWNEVYPSYNVAKRNIETNYKSLLTIEEYLYRLLRKGARVINVSSACGHLSNLKNKKWIEMLMKKDLTTEQVNNFVDEYLESVKNATFDKNDFADDGRHAEHRVSKIALTALTMIQQRKYVERNISINAVHPGHANTDMSNGTGDKGPDEIIDGILYLIFEASPNLRGAFLWNDKKLVDWYDYEGDYYCKGLW